MGKRGPKSTAPGGYGTISNGYRRVRDPVQKRLRMEHVMVWESVNGPVPIGHHVHHRDDDKLNNQISNLECLTPLQHKRIHSGCVWDGKQWWKPCKLCRDLKPVTKEHWYLSREGWPRYGRCRPCHIAKVVKDKRTRRARVKDASMTTQSGIVS